MQLFETHSRQSNLNFVYAQIARPVLSSCVQAWLGAVVPGTALSNMVVNGLQPDPYIGRNNTRIPDLFHASELYTFWWQNNFTLPAPWKADAGQCAWLWLHGINYSVRAWLNGTELCIYEPEGMFIRRRVHISGHLQAGSAQQSLRLLIEPPKPPGCVDKG